MTNETSVKALEKGRAQFAYECAEKASKKDFKKDYRSYVKKIPSMILANGLGQTLAFIKSKARNNKAYDFIYNQITDYMKSKHTTRIKMPDNENELVEWVIRMDSTTYRYITQEILAFFNWLRRFAEGLIKED